jgi:hypothetical protein
MVASNTFSLPAREHPLLEPLKEIVSGYRQYEEEYNAIVPAPPYGKEVTMLFTLVKDIGRLIQTITRKTMKPRESRGYMDIWVMWQV